MNIKFCLVKRDDAINPVNMGAKYVIDHKSDWVDGSYFKDFITVGYMKGCDFIVYENKAYSIKKSYLFPEDSTIVVLADESVQGCDNLES